MFIYSNLLYVYSKKVFFFLLVKICHDFLFSPTTMLFYT